MRTTGKAKNYAPHTLRNRSTGIPEEVVLFDPQDERNSDLLIEESRFELQADLKKAFARFSALQQRILFRVLMQGLSIEEATQNLRRSGRTWRRWYETEALPKLRTSLNDYRKELREIPTSPAPLPTTTVDATKIAEAPMKCKFCTETFTGKNPFGKLRNHVSKEHSEEFRKAQAHLREADVEVRRVEKELA